MRAESKQRRGRKDGQKEGKGEGVLGKALGRGKNDSPEESPGQPKKASSLARIFKPLEHCWKSRGLLIGGKNENEEDQHLPVIRTAAENPSSRKPHHGKKNGLCRNNTKKRKGE